MITVEEYLNRNKGFNPYATKEEMAPPHIDGEVDMYNNVDKRDVYKSTTEKHEISEETAKRIYDQLGCKADYMQFKLGLDIEQEHEDVTGGNLLETGKIAHAHLKEDPEYYTKLKKMESSRGLNKNGIQ